MDFLGRKGRSNTLKPLHLGTNVGTTLYEKVDPAAVFFAGQLATKDHTTGLVRVAVGTGGAAVGDDDYPGGILGLFGDTRITTPTALAVRELHTVVAGAGNTVKLNHVLVQFTLLGAAPISVANADIIDVSTGLTTTVVNINGAFSTGVGVDLTRGLIALNTVATTLAAGTQVLVTYYYQPVDRHFAVGTDEIAPHGAVTIWKDKGSYLTNVFEQVDNLGNPGLPAINDPLYCSPNGLLTAFPIAGGTLEIVAICRQAPTFDAPFMLIDLRV